MRTRGHEGGNEGQGKGQGEERLTSEGSRAGGHDQSSQVDGLISWPVGRRGRPADQRGRWSLPGANGIRQRLGVSGWRLGRGGKY